ncbi:thioesterase II family protein [Streptomyces piniterrae]|uniref:thioesterase II family protein n=1 Tax=Streptomyces piniterrae TaxID=2571125 RepID=UPI00145FC99E|nr:alpha/beta fold hydrolase [Streptomyces piniterrae]
MLPSATVGAPSSPWIRNHGARTTPRTRLVCFAHSGGGASFFRDWAPGLPDDCELWAIQYPGREDRLHEPFLPDMGALATAITGQLVRHQDLPMVLFGHSMGASVAYEVARRMAFRAPGTVRHLIVSGRMAPHRQPVIPEGEMTHLRSDQEIVDRLTALGGSRSDVLDDPDLRAFVLPAVRNDYRLIESYHARPGPLLPIDITALTGDADDGVRPEDVRAWEQSGSGDFAFRSFPGGHFYLIPRRTDVTEEISRVLRSTTAAGPAAP